MPTAAGRQKESSAQVRRRPLGRPLASDGDERRRLILEAAQRQFARAGYMGTTNREIADQADITTGAIYHYFESKQDLYLAVFEEVDRLILDRYEAVLTDGDAPFMARVVRLLEESTRLNRQDESLAAFIAMAAFEAHRNPDLRPSYEAHQQRISRYFEKVIDEAVATKALPRSDRRATLDFVQVITRGLVWMSVEHHDPAAHTRVTKAVISFLRGELPSEGIQKVEPRRKRS